MEGILIDTYGSVVNFWQQLARDNGNQLKSDDIEHHVLGCKANSTLDHLFPNLDQDERDNVLCMLEFLETNQKYIEIPGVVKFIIALHQKGIPIALVTSAELFKADAVISQFKISDHIGIVVTARDIKRGKPYPDCYEFAAKK